MWVPVPDPFKREISCVAEGSPAGPKWCAGLNKSTICVVSCRAVRDLRLSFVTINRYNFLEHIFGPQFPFQFL